MSATCMLQLNMLREPFILLGEPHASLDGKIALEIDNDHFSISRYCIVHHIA